MSERVSGDGVVFLVGLLIAAIESRLQRSKVDTLLKECSAALQLSQSPESPLDQATKRELPLLLEMFEEAVYRTRVEARDPPTDLPH